MNQSKSCNQVPQEHVQVAPGNRIATADRSSGCGKGPSFVDNEKLQSVTLLAVEEAGIWIESNGAVDNLIGRLQKKPSWRPSPSSFPTDKL
jgi:hypothetical protein